MRTGMKANKRSDVLIARLGKLFQVLIIVLAFKSYSLATADDCITVSGPDYIMVNDSASYSASGSVSGGYSWSSASGQLTIDSDTGEVDAGEDPSSNRGDEEIDVVDNDGNTGNKNLTVFDIQSTTTAQAPDKTGDDRQTVGVGEEVKLIILPDMKVTWSLSDNGSIGNDNRINPEYDDFTNYTAAGHAKTETVTATFKSGDTGQLDFEIVEPSDETAEKTPPDNEFPAEWNVTTGVQGALMNLAKEARDIGGITINPRNVSFVNLELVELSEYASNITGYFTQYDGSNKLSHDPGGWSQLDSNNKDWDQAGFAAWPPDQSLGKWSTGEFDWDIPVKWRVMASVISSSPFGDLPNRLQQFKITDHEGTSAVFKLGQSAARWPW